MQLKLHSSPIVGYPLGNCSVAAHWLLEQVTAGGRGVVRASSSAAGVVGLQSAGGSSGVVAVVAE